MPITGIAATRPQNCGALRRDSSVTTSDIAAAVAIATSVASRPPPLRSPSCTGARGAAARPMTTAPSASRAAAGSAAIRHVAAASAAVASHAKAAAQPAWTTSAARAKLAPSSTVSPVPHSELSTACVA